jgi:DNA modification methylase
VPPSNRLYYGDNLDILRRYIKDESVDLVYLDPPFQSNRAYNVLFKEHTGADAASQMHAFEDTWRWDRVAARTYDKTVKHGGQLAETLEAFRRILGHSDMLAYLAMMAPRLVELHRVLRSTGSLYLHCDTTASHYLKILLDAVFGPQNFRNEIIWKRTSSHNDARRRYGDVSDSLLFYTKSDRYTFNVQYVAYSEEYVTTFYRYTDADGRRYRLSDLRSPNPRPNLTYEYKGYQPHPNGWACTREKMEQYDRDGLLHFPKQKTGRIQFKRYLDTMPGTPVGNVWDDIRPVQSQAAERLGYPTQKPLGLLERIIHASSNPGDVVLDPFCGCGTAVDAAQRTGRRWVGVDITQVAIKVIGDRLRKTYPDGSGLHTVIGEPTTLQDAKALAASDPYQFQWWALGLVDARPIEQKKGADRGIDGRLYFHEQQGGPTKQIIFSVKSGKVDVTHVRDLRGVIDRENAQSGVLISLHEPTRPMRTEAASAGFYTTGWNESYPRLQLLTVAELLDGTGVAYPAWSENSTYKSPPRVQPQGDQASQQPLWPQDGGAGSLATLGP